MWTAASYAFASERYFGQGRRLERDPESKLGVDDRAQTQTFPAVRLVHTQAGRFGNTGLLDRPETREPGRGQAGIERAPQTCPAPRASVILGRRFPDVRASRYTARLGGSVRQWQPSRTDPRPRQRACALDVAAGYLGSGARCASWGFLGAVASCRITSLNGIASPRAASRFFRRYTYICHCPVETACRWGLHIRPPWHRGCAIHPPPAPRRLAMLPRPSRSTETDLRYGHGRHRVQRAHGRGRRRGVPLEGIVSKRFGASYRSGPSRDDQEPGQPRNAESARRALVTPTGVDCGRDSDNTAAMGVAEGWPRLSRGGQRCAPSSDAS